MKTAVVVSVGRTAVLRQIGAGDDHTSICCTSPPAPTATASIRVGSSSGARELLTRRDTGQHCNTSLAAGFRSSRPAAPVSATLPEAAKTAEQTTASVGGWTGAHWPPSSETPSAMTLCRMPQQLTIGRATWHFCTKNTTSTTSTSDMAVSRKKHDTTPVAEAAELAHGLRRRECHVPSAA
jgi:hypothetical protein